MDVTVDELISRRVVLAEAVQRCDQPVAARLVDGQVPEGGDSIDRSLDGVRRHHVGSEIRCGDQPNPDSLHRSLAGGRDFHRDEGSIRELEHLTRAAIGDLAVRGVRERDLLRVYRDERAQ